ncbi:MAG TPA: hypothetical protein VKT32_08055 [Chthonomonadaceae bacterium]|nr:hypothetical protein [Chthonomonadaceae bacterium]
MRRVLLILLALSAVFAGPAQATPFFARTYNFQCTACHSGFPRLNAFGLAFKANGFRIPGAEKSAPLAWQKTVPLAMQIQPTLERFSPGQGEAQFTDSQLLAGGLLTRTTSFYIHHSLWIDDKPLQFPSYEVWVQQILDERSKLMLKIGQFELPYAYSPGTHAITVFGPLMYGAAIQDNDVRLGSPMRGVQLSGILGPVRLYAAVGAPSILSSGNAIGQREFLGDCRDVFLRVATRDQTRNISGFLYLTHPPRSATDPDSRDDGQRYGLEGTLFWRGFQFSGVAVYGENSDPLGNGQKGVMRGAFIEADKMLRPWVGVVGRLEVQTIDVGATHVYSDARTLSVRFYPLRDRNLLRLTAEYQQADHGRSSTALQASVSF